MAPKYRGRGRPAKKKKRASAAASLDSSVGATETKKKPRFVAKWSCGDDQDHCPFSDWKIVVKTTTDDEVVAGTSSAPVFETKTYHVHQIYLTAPGNSGENDDAGDGGSTYFRTLFAAEYSTQEKNGNTSKLELHPLAAKAFPAFLDCLYYSVNEDSINTDNATALYFLADYLQVPALRSLLDKFWKADIKVRRAIKMESGKSTEIENYMPYFRHGTKLNVECITDAATNAIETVVSCIEEEQNNSNLLWELVRMFKDDEKDAAVKLSLYNKIGDSILEALLRSLQSKQKRYIELSYPCWAVSELMVVFSDISEIALTRAQDELGDLGGMESIIRAMEDNPKHKGQQTWGLRALWYLLATHDGNNARVQGKIGLIVKAMKTCELTVETQIFACQILISLNLSLPEMCQAGLMTQVVRAKENHKDNMEINSLTSTLLKRAAGL